MHRRRDVHHFQQQAALAGRGLDIPKRAVAMPAVMMAIIIVLIMVCGSGTNSWGNDGSTTPVTWALAANNGGGTGGGDDDNDMGEKRYLSNGGKRDGEDESMLGWDEGGEGGADDVVDGHSKDTRGANKNKKKGAPSKPPGSGSDNLWNKDHIRWLKSWKEAKAVAKRERKPIMMLSRREGGHPCPACDMLEESIRGSMAIEVLSEHFVMLLLGDHKTPDEAQFSTIPAYAPRTLFLNYKGRVMDYINELGHFPEHLHYYTSASELVATMKEVLRVEMGFETFRAL